MTDPDYQIAIIGGGILGLATAWALAPRLRDRLVVLEAEEQPGRHQSGHNSGVIHSGLYYRPGSEKARTCAAGRRALYRFCTEHGIAHERCGKLVVATRDDELPALAELERRGTANGLGGLRRLAAGELGEFEPHVRGRAGLWVPETGIVDYPAVVAKLAELIQERGSRLLTASRVTAIGRDGGRLVLETPARAVRCRHLVNCAGLHCDRVARLAGARPEARIVPFRGEYYRLAAAQRDRVRNLIYPVPDPRFPFLGVHFTRRIDGTVEAGPNAVLALARHGYSWSRVSLRDSAETLAFPGFWRLAARYPATGLAEVWRSLSRSAYAAALAELIPGLGPRDIEPAGAGVRAQAVLPDGRLVDDFLFHEEGAAIHVLNAPSPGATASLAIGEAIARRARERFGLA